MYICVQSIQVFWWCVKVKICWIHKQSRSLTSVWKFTCMIWYMRRQSKISGLRLGCCRCMIWYIIDDKCVKFCMMLYDIWESNLKNFGIKAWLLFSVIFEKYSCLFLTFLAPLLSLSSQTRYKSYKKNLKIETEAYQIMSHLCKICNHSFPPQFSSF